jgi:hypothetical protein
MNWVKHHAGLYTAEGPGGTWTIRRDTRWWVDSPSEKGVDQLARFNDAKHAAARIAQKARRPMTVPATEPHWETTDECATMCGINLVVVPDGFPDGVPIASTLDLVRCPLCVERLSHGCADCGHDVDEHNGTGVCPICDCPSYRDHVTVGDRVEWAAEVWQVWAIDTASRTASLGDPEIEDRTMTDISLADLTVID